MYFPILGYISYWYMVPPNLPQMILLEITIVIVNCALTEGIFIYCPQPTLRGNNADLAYVNISAMSTDRHT